MLKILWSGALILVLAVPAFAQKDGDLITTRVFYRAHLRNGNVIEGTSFKRDDAKQVILLRIGTGEITVRYENLEKTDKGEPRVEEVRVRERREKAPVVHTDTETQPHIIKKPDDKQPKPRDRNKKKTEPKKITWKPVEPSHPISTSKETKDLVDAAIKDLQTAEVNPQNEILERVTALPGALEYAADLIDRVTDDVRSFVVLILTRKTDSAAAGVLADKLTTTNLDIRIQVLNIFATHKDVEPTSAVRPCLKDADPRVRAAAVQSLREDENSLDDLIAACGDTDAGVSRSAMGAVHELATKLDKSDYVVKALMDLIGQRSGKAKAEIVLALTTFSPKDAQQLLTELLSDAEPQVRANAAMALGELKTKESIDPIINRLRSEDVSWVKIQLMTALQKTGSTEVPVLEALVQQLDDSDQEVVSRASSCLIHLTNQNSFGMDRAKWNDWLKSVKGNQ